MRGERNSWWIGEPDEILKRGWSEGKTAAVIAGEIGVSRSAVLGRVDRLRRKGQLKEKQPADGQTKHTSARSVAARARSRALSIEAADEIAPNVADMAIPAEQRLKLAQLTNETCRWPCGDPAHPEFFYCGAIEANLRDGRPYCLAHGRRATRKPLHVTVEERARRIRVARANYSQRFVLPRMEAAE